MHLYQTGALNRKHPTYLVEYIDFIANELYVAYNHYNFHSEQFSILIELQQFDENC